MAKFYGVVGFAVTEEIRPGVYLPTTISDREYAGDVTRNTRRYENSGKVNDDLNISNVISIVADPFAYENFHTIRYVEYMGTKWKVTTVEVQYPRLLLTVGGVYNGDDGDGEET